MTTQTLNFAVPEAVYHPTGVPEYAGHPLIEALPALPSDDKALDDICWQPRMSPEERLLPTGLRIARLLRLRNLLIPLDRHLAARCTLDAILRESYVSRWPQTAKQARIAQRLYELQQSGQSFTDAEGEESMPLSMALFGIPGMGKTNLVRRWRNTMQKVIYHPAENIYQVPVLISDAPSDGSSLKGFCYSLLHQLDERIPGANYYYEYGVRNAPGADAMLRNVVRLMNMHFLGALVIDETQNFANARKNGEIVMTEVVSAFNLLNCAIIFLGTNKAYTVFKDFRSGRRLVQTALPHWDRLPQYVSAGVENEWVEVVRTLWRLQWVRYPVELDEMILNVLYECSQGVLAILVALFAAAQARAMFNKSEKITAQLIQEVYTADFGPVHPMISALAKNDQAALARFQDIAKPLDSLLWNGPWAVGGSSAPSGRTTPAAYANTAEDQVSDQDAPKPKRKRARPSIASRVPQATTRKPRESSAKETSASPTQYEPGDYRNAGKAAQERQSSGYEELQRLGMTGSIDDVIGGFQT
jgi:hypothetical protein